LLACLTLAATSMYTSTSSIYMLMYAHIYVVHIYVVEAAFTILYAHGIA